jgi:hypothetical protein
MQYSFLQEGGTGSSRMLFYEILPILMWFMHTLW